MMERPLPSRRPRRLVLATAAFGLVASAPSHAQVSSGAAGLTVAKVEWADRPVEGQADGEDAWRRLGAGDPVRTGDRLRTPSGGIARLDFPWMSVTLGPASVLSIPAAKVLSTVLEEGRAEFSGSGRDIVKIRVGRSEIRGGGRLVLWHEGERTAAAALDGAFRVSAAGVTVTIQAGEGTSVKGGQAPLAAQPLPEPPTGLVPGNDPVYVRAGEPAALHWVPGGGTHHVEVLDIAREEVLMARNVGSPPTTIRIPWRGTFRWRVSARDDRGLESLPSAAGYLCVIER